MARCWRVSSPASWIVLLTLLANAPALATVDPVAPRTLCSGGSANGTDCTSDDACEGGVCVRAHAVCDGGSDDRFDCPCPGGSCAIGSGCGGDADLGTCAGGWRDGACCDPLVTCADGVTCVATAMVCVGGPEKGYGCLRDAHCPESTCAAMGRACRGGIFGGLPCVDHDECRGGGFCEGDGFSSPTPTPVGCIDNCGTCTGDCDGSGSVTVNELVMLVNIGLGAMPPSMCTAGDADGDGSITVDEIITAVRHGLEGCPPSDVP